MAPRPGILAVPRVTLAMAGLAGFLAGSLPGRAQAEPTGSEATSPDAQEPLAQVPSTVLDQYPPPSARTNLLIAGAASTAAWYGLALGSSYLWPDTVGAKDLRIPIAGPWVAFSHSGCGNVSDCSKALVVLRAIATLVDGIGQAAGLGLVAEGLFLPTQEQKRKRAELMPKASSGVQWRPTFDAGKNTVGFGVLGVF
jgi:hypothetical protein